MSLIVENLSVRRGGFSVLHEVSMTCPPGTALILRGPNGVGKTTLLRTLAGFIPAASGSATLNGAPLSDRDAFQSHLAYTGHADAIKAQLTVEENIHFWADLYGSSSPTDALNVFDLRPLSDRLAGRCSAGQKRRLGLARMLVSERNLWLMDEPTVSLDAASRDTLSSTIKAHLGTGGMAVIATHDTDLVKGQTAQMTPPPAMWEQNAYWDGEPAL